MQEPPKQRCPLPHRPPPDPHRQTPPSQRSAFEPQAVHAPPPLPHWDVDGETQVLPEQQPDGQDVALHTQTPPWQRWPAPHAAPPPHRHWPPLQVSATVLSQATHAAPPEPQAATEVPVWQAPP